MPVLVVLKSRTGTSASSDAVRAANPPPREPSPATSTTGKVPDPTPSAPTSVRSSVHGVSS